MIKAIHKLVQYGLDKDLIDPLDIDYVVNRLSEMLAVEPSIFQTPEHPAKDVVACLEPILEHAASQGMIENIIEERDNFESKVMDLFTPKPSQLQKTFDSLSPKASTAFFYQLSRDNHYIKTERIKKNKHFNYDSDYGQINITINLSKPEKDPKTIAKLKKQKSMTYPACLLCKENVGFYGHLSHPGRSNHRIIKMTLNNEPFYFQYSPYVYYNEHAIVLHEAHIPMDISIKTFIRLFDFIDRFPHYFLGSNAGLPIVGGSILNHEHYQGGSAKFPIEDAKSFKSYQRNQVRYELLHWPLSVVRLSSKNRSALIKEAESLRRFYEKYSDETVNLINKTDTMHNAITPIARFKNNTYILDVALRNNRTDEKYPDGIFHPHQDVHAIKKENIGLIEVMGLAILPGRLNKDLDRIEEALTNDQPIDASLSTYQRWIESIELSDHESVRESINKAVGKTFVKGLEDCGIFKPTLEGQKSFTVFMEHYFNE